MHPHRSNKDIDYFENLKAKVMRQNSLPNMFKKGITKDKEGMVVPYNISKLIEKDGKPHSIGETLILPAITEVISTVMNPNAAEIIRSIPLSNDTVARGIDEMANDVEIQILQTTEFSLQFLSQLSVTMKLYYWRTYALHETEQHQKSYFLLNH